MKDTTLNFPDYPRFRGGKNLTNNPTAIVWSLQCRTSLDKLLGQTLTS